MHSFEEFRPGHASLLGSNPEPARCLGQVKLARSDVIGWRSWRGKNEKKTTSDDYNPCNT